MALIRRFSLGYEFLKNKAKIIFIFDVRSMTRLTHYTSFEDLKSSKIPIHPRQEGFAAESELKDFFAHLRTNRQSKSSVKAIRSSNHLTNGK